MTGHLQAPSQSPSQFMAGEARSTRIPESPSRYHVTKSGPTTFDARDDVVRAGHAGFPPAAAKLCNLPEEPRTVAVVDEKAHRHLPLQHGWLKHIDRRDRCWSRTELCNHETMATRLAQRAWVAAPLRWWMVLFARLEALNTFLSLGTPGGIGETTMTGTSCPQVAEDEHTVVWTWVCGPQA